MIVSVIDTVRCDDCGVEVPVSASTGREARRQVLACGWTRHPDVSAWQFDPILGWGWWGKLPDFPLGDRCPRCTIEWHRRRVAHQRLSGVEAGIDLLAVVSSSDVVRQISRYDRDKQSFAKSATWAVAGAVEGF